MAFHRFAVEDRIIYKSRKRYVVFVGGHERFTNSLINRWAWTAHDRENYKKRGTTKRSTTKRNTTKRSTSREAPQERHHKRGTTREIPQREVPRSWTEIPRVPCVTQGNRFPPPEDEARYKIENGSGGEQATKHASGLTRTGCSTKL